MARSSSNLPNNYSSNLEIRIERLERTCNGLEARLINLTTLIRSQYNKNESSGDNSFEKFSYRIEKLEAGFEDPVKKIESIEKRLVQFEKSLADNNFRKNFEETHEKIRECMKDLKENLKLKEKEFCEKFECQIRNLKENFKFQYKATEREQKDNGDEIDNIIKELQDRIKKKTPCQSRAESFSVLRNKSNTPKNSERKVKKANTKRSKKFNN